MQIPPGIEAENSAEHAVCKRDFFPGEFPQFMFDLKFSFFAIGEKGHNLQTHVSFLAVRFKTAEKILSRQQPVCQKEDSASSRGNNDLPIRGTGADFQFSSRKVICLQLHARYSGRRTRVPPSGRLQSVTSR